MADNYYGKGIKVASGFDLGAKSPLDSRIVVNTIAERNAHVTNNRVYEGMIVYVVEEQTNYQYIDSSWVELKAGSTTVNVTDSLTSTNTSEALSANQGRILKEQIDEQNAEVVGRLNGVEGTLTNIDGRLNGVEGSLANIGERLNGVEGNATNIDERLNGVEGTLTNIDERLSDVEGNVNIHIGTEPPQDTTYVWIDTSVPFNLDVSTYEGRMRLKYVEMLDHVIDKVHSLSEKIDKIQRNINKISSDNSVKMNELKRQLSSIRSKITSLLTRVNETQYQLMNGGNLPTLKNTAKQLRKEMKQDVLYGLADLNYNVMVVLDSEIQFIQPDPDNPSTPDDPSIDVDGSTLLTEDGFMLLTEDGLVILIDDATSSDGIEDAILTELGQVILTEDGSIILIDGGTSSDESIDILQGAILTEQGKVLLLKNGKQLLKG